MTLRRFAYLKALELFPTLSNKNEVQKLWEKFYSLVEQLKDSKCDEIDEFEKSAKTWVTKFVTLYQSKDVTPAFSMHVSQFLRSHGNISSFT